MDIQLVEAMTHKIYMDTFFVVRQLSWGVVTCGCILYSSKCYMSRVYISCVYGLCYGANIRLHKARLVVKWLARTSVPQLCQLACKNTIELSPVLLYDQV